MSDGINNAIGNTKGVDASSYIKHSGPEAKPEKVADPSGNSGSGVSANVGQAFTLGEVYNPDVIAALAKANSQPEKRGLTAMAMKTIFGSAYDAATGLLPQRATDADRALLAGAFVSEDQI